MTTTNQTLKERSLLDPFHWRPHSRQVSSEGPAVVYVVLHAVQIPYEKQQDKMSPTIMAKDGA